MRPEDIVVYPARAIPHIDTPLPWAMISIVTFENTWPDYNSKNCKKVLRLAFHDATPDSPNTLKDHLFNIHLANMILDFVEEVQHEIKMLVVHCEAGLSRSPAIAAAISNWYFQDDKKYFKPPYFPNNFVYRTLMQCVRQRGWK